MTYKCVFVTNSLSETEIRASGDTKRPLAPKVPKWDNDLRVSFRYISHLRYIKAPPFSSCASIFKMSKNYTVPYRSTVIFSLNSSLIIKSSNQRNLDCRNFFILLYALFKTIYNFYLQESRSLSFHLV